MKARFQYLVSLTLILLIGQLPSVLTSHAGKDDPLCFSQTGECIPKEFRAYWEQNGGLPVFGYPITPARPEIDNNTSNIYFSQWYERNRLEVHPENAQPFRVLLGRLSDDILRQDSRNPQAFPKADASAPHYFPQTGHSIADVFWNYWSHQGLDLGETGISGRESLALFGYPISEAQMETSHTNGEEILTQWFERARFEYHPNNAEQYKVLLGLLGSEIKPRSPRPAVERLNYYRRLVGSPLLEQRPALVIAAQSHTNYLGFNLTSGDPHAEFPGGKGFTGKTGTERIKAAGYPWTPGSDLYFQFFEDQEDGPVRSVDAWIDLPLHRVLVLKPNYRHVGYGDVSRTIVADNGARVTHKFGVMDFGFGPSDTKSAPSPIPLAYPYDKQTGVPTSWNYSESPYPLPEGATFPPGYPFSLQGAYGTLCVDDIQMRNTSGQIVPSHRNPTTCLQPGYNCYVLFPIAPLQPGAVYTVYARGAVDKVTFDRTWQFTTSNSQP